MCKLFVFFDNFIGMLIKIFKKLASTTLSAVIPCHALKQTISDVYSQPRKVHVFAILYRLSNGIPLAWIARIVRVATLKSIKAAVNIN